MKIKAHCPFLGHTGYNAHTRGFFTALNDLVDLRVDNYTWCDDRHNYLNDEQKRIISEITLDNDDGTQGQYPPDWKKEIEDFKYDVDIVLHEHGHPHFWRDYEKPKIACTIWETDLMHNNFFKRLLDYNELWVPSLWQKECAIKQGYPSDRVQVVPSGVEPDCVPLSASEPTDDSIFTFCVVGTWGYRKATNEIVECFVELFGNDPKVQLILSTDNPVLGDGPSTKERLKLMGWGDINNIVIKSFPDRKQYINMLQASHVFLSCSRGEGWNIPLIEAMACGIPSIYSDCAGQTEFAQGNGIPVRILGKQPTRPSRGPLSRQERYLFSGAAHPGHYFSPDFTHLKKKMRHCVDNYHSLKQAALQESHEIRKKFSWGNAARSAKSHLDSFYRRYGIKNPQSPTDTKVLFPLITCNKSPMVAIANSVLHVPL